MEFRTLNLRALIANLAYVRWQNLPAASAQEIARAAADALIAPAGYCEQVLGSSHWSLASCHEDVGSGFAASVFASDDGKVLAIRGTQDTLTLVSTPDGQIPVEGLRLGDGTRLLLDEAQRIAQEMAAYAGAAVGLGAGHPFMDMHTVFALTAPIAIPTESRLMPV